MKLIIDIHKKDYQSILNSGQVPYGVVCAIMNGTPLTKTPKGRWVKEESILGWDGCSYQCSNCGRSIHLDTVIEDLSDYPYCHCGAEMSGGGEDG